MLLVLQKEVSVVLGNLFHQPPVLVLLGSSFPLHPQCLLLKAAWSSPGSWHLFSKAGVIRQVQEEPNPSSVPSVWESLQAVSGSLSSEIDTSLYGLSGGHSSHVGLAVGSSLQLCPFSFLPQSSLCVYQCVQGSEKHIRSCSSSWGAPGLDLCAKAP